MKNAQIGKMLVAVSLLGMACAHYDPERPDFKKKASTAPNFESGDSTTQVDPPAKVLGGSDSSSNSDDTAEINSDTKPTSGDSNKADPMTGPGMSSAPVPIPTQPKEETVPTGPVKSATYEEAVVQIDKAKAKDVNLKNFWVGSGYDVLTGNRLPTCLEPSNLRTTVTSRMETTDSYSVAHDYKDLYSKLENEFGADIGGMWQIFTGSLSFKTKIMKETRMTTDDVVVIAGFTYLRDQIALNNPGSTYGAFFQSLSEKNRELFRKYCGDKYTKDVSVGASMHLVFTAKKTDSSKWDQTKVDAAIRIGLAGILGFGANSSTSTEQKAILNSYSFSTKCYTLGTSSDICGGYSSNTAFDINNDIAAIQTKIAAVKAKMFTEVKEGKYLAVVKETLLDYEVPIEACDRDTSSPCPSRWEYFSDYRDRLTKLRKMSLNKSEADDVCSKTPYWEHRCQHVTDLYGTAVNNCLSLSEDCKVPDETEFNKILSAKNPGSIEMWDNMKYTGSFWGLDFRNLLNGGNIEANKFYSLRDIGMDRANDKISSLKSHLQPAWTIRFYRDTDPASPGQPYDVTGSREIFNIGDVWGKGANDSISSFQLIPMPDM